MGLLLGGARNGVRPGDWRMPPLYEPAIFWAEPAVKMWERSVPPITLLNTLRALFPMSMQTRESANPVAVQLQFSCSLFNRFAHSAGPGMVRHRVVLIGIGMDDLMRSSKGQEGTGR